MVHYQAYRAADVKYFLAIGLAAFAYQSSVSIAYKFEKASRLSPIMYLAVLIGSAADVAILSDSLGISEICGGLLVLCCLMVPWALRYSGKVAH